MNAKRSLNQISPEQTSSNSAKKSTPNNFNNFEQSRQIAQMGDEFSWAGMRQVLEEQMKDVAKKEDLVAMQTDINLLKEENEALKRELRSCSSRLEVIDQRSRCSNIVIDGMLSKNPQEAKTELAGICSNNLKIHTDIVGMRKLPNKNSYIATLGSSAQAFNIIEAKNKLKNSNIFIKKDYTKAELDTQYNLRQIRKALSADKTLKVRLGEFCVYVNDQKYTWSDGKIQATSYREALFLTNLLKKINFVATINVKASRFLKSDSNATPNSSKRPAAGNATAYTHAATSDADTAPNSATFSSTAIGANAGDITTDEILMRMPKN